MKNVFRSNDRKRGWVISEYRIAPRRRTQEIRRQIWRTLMRRFAHACSQSRAAFVADRPLAEPPES